MGFFRVLGSHMLASSNAPSTGDSVRNFIYSRDKTLDGSDYTSPRPLKAPCMFYVLRVALNAARKSGKKSDFVMCVIVLSTKLQFPAYMPFQRPKAAIM